VDSESLSFRGATVSAVVNRVAPDGRDDQEAAWSLLGGSAIELLKADLPTPGTAPKLGEIFTETNGTKHRIIQVRATTITWKLDCAPVDPEDA